MEFQSQNVPWVWLNFKFCKSLWYTHAKHYKDLNLSGWKSQKTKFCALCPTFTFLFNYSFLSANLIYRYCKFSIKTPRKGGGGGISYHCFFYSTLMNNVSTSSSSFHPVPVACEYCISMWICFQIACNSKNSLSLFFFGFERGGRRLKREQCWK